MERQFRLNWPALVEEAIRQRQRLNLNQHQLAGLANVSQPTVSRFERAEKDIQLSSVLAILEVLGLTDRRALVFPSDDYRFDIAEGVRFWADDRGTPVTCRIAREGLDDKFRVTRGRAASEAAFLKHRREIESEANRKYQLGLLEPDGSVLLRSEDLF